MNANALTLSSHAGTDGLESIYQAWLDLLEGLRSQGLYQRPEWFDAYFKSSVKGAGDVQFVCVWQGPLLAAIVPLIFTSSSRLPSVVDCSVAKRDQLYMPDAIIDARFEPSEIVQFLLNSLDTLEGCRWDTMTIRETLASGCFMRGLTSLPRIHVQNLAHRCLLIEVMEYGQARRAMKKNYRGNLSKKNNKIKQLDHFQFFHDRAESRVSELFEEFVVVEGAGWKGGHGELRGTHTRPAAISLSQVKQNFYREVYRSLARAGLVDVFSLRTGNQLMAMQICVTLGETSYMIKTTYDESFGDYSPGHLVFDFGYQHYAERGDVRFINMILENPHFAGWPHHYVDYQSARVFNSGWRARLLNLAYAGRRALKR